MSFVEAPARPPRPQHVPQDVLEEAARRVGMRPREIVGVTDTKAGRIIEIHDGTALIDVPADRPDGAGRTGLLMYRGPAVKNSPTPQYVGQVLPPQAANEAWSVADLDLAASRLMIPAPEPDRGGASHQGWIGVDPVRARAVWLQIAERARCDTEEAARIDGEASHCRRVILAAGWLSAREAKSL